MKGSTLTPRNESNDLDILGNSVVKLLDKNENIIEETFTDDNGNFQFKVYSEEDYILIGEKENYFNTRGGFSTIGKSLDKSKYKYMKVTQDVNRLKNRYYIVVLCL